MRKIVSAVTLVLLAACSDPTGSGPTTDVRVQTDKRSYGVIGNQAVPVAFSITNSTDAAVELAACGSVPAMALERREAGRWASYASSICPANVVMTPIPLAPGETLSSALNIQGVTGTFRIVLPNPDLGIREPRAISPTFEVHEMLD